MNIEEDEYPVRLTLICETCTYTEREVRPRFYYSWNELLEHARKEHWTRTTQAGNGQWRYLCQHCDREFQTSSDPVVDFACNLYCSITCARQAYEARLDSQETISLIRQEKRDEEYVLKSLKGEL